MNTPETNTDQQVKSNERVQKHGEVFTAEREVNAMLDLVKQETERIDARFLEPACGNGNFLAEILRRKLEIVENRYKNNQPDWERYAVLAVSSIYGIDILEDNVKECRERLFGIFNEKYRSLYDDNCKEECCKSVKYLLKCNILWGDALDYTNPETKVPVVFSEWSAVNGVYLKRRDYKFRFLVEKTHQFSLFNDEGNAASIDQPVKDDYPVIPK
jgi:SAM-dependent methyltransferase